MGCTALQKATQRTESKALALLGAGVVATADAAAIASSLILSTKTSSWEAQGLAKSRGEGGGRPMLSALKALELSWHLTG